MFRAQLPRLYQLRDLIADLASPDAYFPADFETRLQVEPSPLSVFACWENKLQFLDEESWKVLKNEAAPYLTRRDPRRGWHQLFDILGQADAYIHLRNIGCSRIRFIPRSATETPDLEGTLDSGRILCEVKTINISDAEVDARGNLTSATISSQLDERFVRKLDLGIARAKHQLRTYDPTGGARHLVYINIEFDDWVGYYEKHYWRQLDQHLSDHPPGVEVVFRNPSDNESCNRQA
jgi:hypothetical protein